MRPIPVLFHLGPLVVHTYGIGLTVTFWLGYLASGRRLQRAGYPDDWLAGALGWILLASILGARAVHVAANWSTYAADPAQIPAVWHGGLSSFGGLAGGVPVGLLLARRPCPGLSPLAALDLAAPVLAAAWGVGRLLGPQLMVAGGGQPTTAWYGLSYAGQVGRRVPVPLIQAADCFAIYVALVLAARRWPGRLAGGLIAMAATLWGIAPFLEEAFFLRSADAAGGAGVLWTGLLLGASGLAMLAFLAGRGWRSGGSPRGGAAHAGLPEARGGPGA